MCGVPSSARDQDVIHVFGGVACYAPAPVLVAVDVEPKFTYHWHVMDCFVQELLDSELDRAFPYTLSD